MNEDSAAGDTFRSKLIPALYSGRVLPYYEGDFAISSNIISTTIYRNLRVSAVWMIPLSF